MKDFINWCFQHWQFLLSILGILASILILIIKPRTKANTWDYVLQKVLSLIPGFIYEAETQVITGKEKKELVISLCEKMAHRLLHRKLTNDEYVALNIAVDKQVEGILFCPTKKGGIGRGS